MLRSRKGGGREKRRRVRESVRRWMGSERGGRGEEVQRRRRERRGRMDRSKGGREILVGRCDYYWVVLVS